MTDTETEQRDSPPETPQESLGMAPAGPRQIFRNVTHTLSDDELTNPAVVKMIIDRIYTAEVQRDDFKRYVALYYASDKQAGILIEKLKANLVNEIMFGVGLTIGGAVFGLVPYFWDKDRLQGTICIFISAVLVVGSVLARAYHGSSK